MFYVFSLAPHSILGSEAPLGAFYYCGNRLWLLVNSSTCDERLLVEVRVAPSYTLFSVTLGIQTPSPFHFKLQGHLPYLTHTSSHPNHAQEQQLVRYVFISHKKSHMQYLFSNKLQTLEIQSKKEI